MEGQELLDYVKEVKELEAAVYANEQMCREFPGKAKQKEPHRPVLAGLEDETRPSRSIPAAALRKRAEEEQSKGLALIIVGIVCLLIGIALIGVSASLNSFSFLIFLLCILFLVVGGVSIKNGATQRSSANLKADLEIAREIRFLTEIDQIIERNNEKKSAYNAAMAEYTKKKDEYDAMRGSQLSLLTEAGTALRTARDTLYQMDVIYPKYRNIVAVSSIYEYLASGRCSRLDGPDGAYNLYEMELRQNIVIGQLSAISGNLEQIKNNQYTLYQDLLTANHQSFEMLSDISDSAKYSAYSSEATAKNTEALKFKAYWDHANRRH